MIRDPYFQQIEELIEEQKPNGPRGMDLVPNEQAHLLAGLELYESRQHDLTNSIQDALVAHKREIAAGLLRTSSECLTLVLRSLICGMIK